MPFPIRGIDSDNGSEFINFHLLSWCDKHQITFTRSRVRNKNYGCHVEQKNWSSVRTLVGYHRYDTAAELALLNQIWVLQSQMTNYFLPQQKLISKVRHGAKVTKKYDKATTPHRRAERHDAVTAEDKTILTDTYTDLNPAAIQRRIQALTAQLLTLTTSKAAAVIKPAPMRASAHESTKPATRASWHESLGSWLRHSRRTSPHPSPHRHGRCSSHLDAVTDAVTMRYRRAPVLSPPAT